MNVFHQWPRKICPCLCEWIADVEVTSLSVMKRLAQEQTIARIKYSKIGLEWQEIKGQVWDGLIIRICAPNMDASFLVCGSVVRLALDE